MTVTVLIADDQALVRAGFRMMLNTVEGFRVVGEAFDGEHAVTLAAQTAPDVILMDVRMPVLDGIGATRRILDTGTRTRVLILTTFDHDEYAYEGLRAGASGFLLKDVMPDALFEAIRAVAAGDAVLTPRITKDLIDRFARDAGPAVGPAARSAFAELTPREREVFTLLTTGLSNAEIAVRLFLTEATVKTHITRLLTKLKLRDRVQVVIFAYENGLV